MEHKELRFTFWWSWGIICKCHKEFLVCLGSLFGPSVMPRVPRSTASRQVHRLISAPRLVDTRWAPVSTEHPSTDSTAFSLKRSAITPILSHGRVDTRDADARDSEFNVKIKWSGLLNNTKIIEYAVSEIFAYKHIWFGMATIYFLERSERKRSVSRKMFRGSRVDNALDKVVVLGNEILTVVHNEYTAGIEFDMMLLRFLDSKRSKGAL